MKNLSNKTLALFLSLSLVVLSSIGIILPRITIAASITSAKDTMTRLKISTNADHTVVFTLPTGVDFDSGDELRIDFPSGFAETGTWVTGDFTVSDGSATDVNAVEDTATPNGAVIGCTDDANNVGIEIDNVNLVFAIIPCGGSYTASATAATITFTIDGSAGDGELANPSSAASYSIDIANDEDNDSDNDDTTSLAVGVADDDQVTVTATVTSSLTFDLDTDSDGGTDEGVAPYSVLIGTITTTDTRVSGTTDAFAIVVAEADTNATGGVVVTVLNANGTSGLVSTSTPSDNINSADDTMADGTENYGLCVATAGLSGFARASPYDTGACATNTETNVIYNLTTTGENILSTSGPVSAAHAEIIVNAAIAGTTVAHTDYTDTLTFIATATF